ncbi:nucleotidyltransferase family protein [Paenibacillus polygoni]|uniref:Nucleotidyltransferase family protein n=1 Tax=Paenibacillus polygoni TaxID=3050112 RepID=A0ABY8WZW9_9BACL|nr:nucleotidyltransferase family protein [Paenibacillus polygoni]WIV17731.1 nucleotidyltransferase family protein [Paenibacillus polygoni]
MRTAGVVLAAGQSQRMGEDKINLALSGAPLGSYAVNAALHSHLDLVILVVRADDPLRWLVNSPNDRLIITRCTDSKLGMSHSLRCGWKEAADRGMDCVLILLADQPLVQTEHINALLDVYSSAPELHYVAAKDGDVVKPPLLLSSKVSSVIFKLEGDTGARSIIRNSAYAGKQIPFDKEVFYDADTPDALLYLGKLMDSYKEVDFS